MSSHRHSAHSSGRLIHDQYRLVHQGIERLRRRSSPARVHDTRVAARQLSAVLTALAPALPGHARHDLQHGLKALIELLGRVRDARVRAELLNPLLKRVPPSDRRQRILSLLDATSRQARVRARRALVDATFDQRLTRMSQAARTLTRRARSRLKTKALLREAARKHWARLTRGLGNPHPSAHEIHRMRLLTKKCRYLLLSASGAAAANSTEWLKHLQSCLGDLHDLDQARGWLRQQLEPWQPDAAAQRQLREREALLNKDLHQLRRRQPTFLE